MSSTTHLPQNTSCLSLQLTASSRTAQGVCAAPHKWDFTLSQLNPHTVAVTGTTVSVTASTSETLMGIFWPLGTSALHTEKTHQVLPQPQEHTHLPGCCVCAADASHCRAWTFQNSQGVPLLWRLFIPNCDTCLIYRQRSHLSPSSSPAQPTASPSQSLTQVNLQALHDNIPWSNNSGNLQRCLLQTCLIEHHFNSKQKKIFLVMGH